MEEMKKVDVAKGEKYRDLELTSRKLADLEHDIKIKQLNLEAIKGDIEKKIKELNQLHMSIDESANKHKQLVNDNNEALEQIKYELD